MRHRFDASSFRSSSSLYWPRPRHSLITRWRAQFDTSKSLTLKGTISKVEWINPHIYVYLDVKDADGTMATWALETLPTASVTQGRAEQGYRDGPARRSRHGCRESRQRWAKRLAWVGKINVRGWPLLSVGRRWPDRTVRACL